MTDDEHMLMCLAEYLRSVDKDAAKAFDYASKVDELRRRIAAPVASGPRYDWTVSGMKQSETGNWVTAGDAADSAMAKDAERLSFVIDKQGIIVSKADVDGVRRYQLYRICEFATGVILSGNDRWFDEPRDAIDAAIAASAQ